MNKKSHNKKRNVGIIYEQLVLRLSKALVENDNRTFKEVKKIIREFFSKNTEIYKEQRLISSLAAIDIKDTSIIPIILEETKKATWKINKRKLNKEKSFLVKRINERLGKEFFSTKISNYRDYATISILVEEYKKSNKADPKTLIEYSVKVSEIIKKEKVQEQKIEDLKDPSVDNLVMKIMFEKFNKNYLNELSKEQIDILNEWAINKEKGNIKNLISTAKLKAMNSINEFKENCNNDILLSKIDSVEKNIINETFDIISEDSVVKAMTMCEIANELAEEE